jgi:hypothetical protein
VAISSNSVVTHPEVGALHALWTRGFIIKVCMKLANALVS